MISETPASFYESLFNHMFDGLAYCQMIFDKKGRPVDFVYIQVNKNFAKLTGLKNVVGKKVTDVIPGIHALHPELFEIYGRVSVTGKSERFEMYVRPLSRWFFVSVYSPQKGFFVAVFQNTTKEKRIEKDLENAKIAAMNVLEDLQEEKEALREAIAREKEIDKAKSEFVSLASHQLRTPLTTVSWYVEMILRGDVGEVVSSQKKYLEEIYQGNSRMVELVNTLLDVSRIELGTFFAKPEPTDIVLLAESLLRELKVKIEQKKLVITQKFNKNIPIFSADPSLLRMVLQNILMNAVKYTPEGGKIRFWISLDQKDKGKKEKQVSSRGILITVSDTGCGIPKNQQDRIFTKLFRADNVRNKDASGTGLGLYIAKSIVLNSGGEIWFESEENKGTTFYVALPFDGGVKKKKGSDKMQL